MMDMEMNTELERDGGSEIGDASYEGSSAGSAYCSLEQDFARITSEMKSNESLAAYEAEYVRLYESLYKAHRLEEELTEKCKFLKEEVTAGADKIQELEKKIKSDAESMEYLKREILDGKKLADVAHTREQKAQDVIENLRVSITKLTDELDQKNKQAAADENSSTATKQKDDESKDRERLVGEIETLRFRLKAVTAYKQEVEEKLNESEQQANELQEKFDRQTNEMSKERRDHEKMEFELQLVREELKSRLAELETAEEALKTTTGNMTRQDNILRGQVLENEKNQKEMHALMLKQMSLRNEMEKVRIKLEDSKQELSERNKYIKEMSKDSMRLKEDIRKLKTERGNNMKILTKERSLNIKSNENVKRITGNLHTLELEIAVLNRQLVAERKTIDKLNREKEATLKNSGIIEDMNKKLTLEVRVLEQANRKTETSLEDVTEESNELKRQIKALEKEKDRYTTEIQELTEQAEDYMDEVKLKRLEIVDYQKEVAETEAKLRQQRSVFDDVRAERNTYKKNLSVCQEEVADLKSKLKELNSQMELVKEQLTLKEANLAKQEFLFSKTEKEKESLKSELQTSRKNVSEIRREIEDMRQEQKRLRSLVQEADTNAARQHKEIEAVINERDVIGTQIVRRNDEMSLQYRKIRILEESLQRGEKQYAQRLDEIRMLQLEVKKLKFEKSLLEKNTANMCNLRGEIFHLERNLTKERVKVMALEEEVQNPLNVHRWRNLEAMDPDSYELLRKVQILQKRILKMSEELISKEKKIKQTEKLYINLREIIAKQPGPEVLTRLAKTRQALRNRGKKMKSLVAELNMAFSTENQFELDKVKQELRAVKSRYFAQKKKEQKLVEPANENLPSVPENSIRFLGGGFNLSKPIDQISTTPLNTLNK